MVLIARMVGCLVTSTTSRHGNNFTAFVLVVGVVLAI